MLVVVALGGNALLRRDEDLEAETQRRNVECAARVIAELAQDHELVVTHGNGPQVGLLALQSEAYAGVAPYPLDVLGAESEGMIGYLLEQELRKALPEREVATLLTQIEVDPKDPAFEKPSKPIGPVHSGRRARVVPSPEPKRILEIGTIRLLVDAKVLVICAGGGGIPVAATATGALHGVEAVIDKDLASALLATSLGADALLLLTDQPAVFEDWPEPARRPLRSASIDELRSLPLDPGSMGPKVEAACRFAEATGGQAAIGALEDGVRILQGLAGTSVQARTP